METTIENFEENPMLKALLCHYCAIHYEDNVSYDDNSLLLEYRSLLQANALNDLFECEKLRHP